MIESDNSHHQALMNESDVIVSHLKEELAETMLRPSMILRPKILKHETKWCAVYGTKENISYGVSGFGDSPDEACKDFDKKWVKSITGT